MGPSLTAVTTRLFVDPVLAAVFPTRCPGCTALLERPSRGPLCARCWAALPRHRGHLCPCGTALGGDALPPCGRCRRGLRPFARGASLGPYEGLVQVLVRELKFARRRRVADRLAEALLQEGTVSALVTPGAVLVPVPLHPRRERERGFNQSALLAQALATRTGLPVRPQALVRRLDTPPQTGLSAAQRRHNVAGAFAARRRGQVAGRVVVLVDDVFTTGATLSACATVLRDAGADEVRVLTVARVA